jgi:NAD(P)-dependent dehydrogenase (short-subunit alcohol dehydrogenase family)
MNLPLKVLITGTNKGIGNELVKAFLKYNPNSVIYATSREKSEIAYERWKSIDTEHRIRCSYLDVSSG